MKIMKISTPVIFLSIVTASTICGVGYVHHRQNVERAEMYEGVKRDLERQRQYKEPKRQKNIIEKGKQRNFNK